MRVNTENYACSICGTRNVKLWRPYVDTTPLLCASCAEERQASLKYEECIWRKENGGKHYSGIFTGKKLSLQQWQVDEKGSVPAYEGPGPAECPRPNTDQLIVYLNDISASYSYGYTTMVPACPTEDDEFYTYGSIPYEIYEWWLNLPTR